MRSITVVVLARLTEILVDFYKLRQTMLLLFTSLISYLIAAGPHFSPRTLVVLGVAVFLTVAGSTGLNMYLEKDIDALMTRTAKRVLPSRKLKENEALLASLVPLGIGIALAFSLGKYVGVAGVMGALVYLLGYTLILKRRTWLSPLVGGIAGGAPAFGGHLAHQGADLSMALFLLALVALWSSLHIWFISSFYLEDYIRARVPMLPVVKGVRSVGPASLLVTILLLLLFYLAFARKLIEEWVYKGLLTLWSPLILVELLYTLKPGRTLARLAYKYLSPCLGLSFLLMLLSKLS